MPVPQGIHTIPDLLDRAAARGGGVIAVRDRGEHGFVEWDYRTWRDWVYRMAAWLREAGVAPREPVAILLPNSRWWGTAFLAVMANDAIAVPLDMRATPEELAVVVRASGVRMLITAASCRVTLDTLAGRGITFARVWQIDAAPAGGAFERELAARAPLDRARRALRHDAALIIYTSGTTGEPKGVVLSHGNILLDVFDLLGMLEIDAHESFVSILPLNHAYEITGGFAAPLALGATITYAGALRPDVIMATIRDARMSVMMVVPAVIRLFMDRIRTEGRRRYGALFSAAHALCRAAVRLKLPLGRLIFRRVRRQISPAFKCFICGGAPVDPALLREFAALGLTVLQGYGLTETSPVIAVNTLRHNRIGTVGRPVASVDIRIAPHEGCTGRAGELWVRGGIVFREYYRNPRATAEHFHFDWFKTGDLVRRERGGYLRVIGRVKNIIVTDGGKNIYPEEIERVLGAAPEVKEVCVVGVRQDGGGERPVAVVVPQREHLSAACGGDRAAQDRCLKQHLLARAAHLADYKRPKELIIRDDVPKTATLKVKRAVLREELERAARQRSPQG